MKCFICWSTNHTHYRCPNYYQNKGLRFCFNCDRRHRKIANSERCRSETSCSSGSGRRLAPEWGSPPRNQTLRTRRWRKKIEHRLTGWRSYQESSSSRSSSCWLVQHGTVEGRATSKVLRTSLDWKCSWNFGYTECTHWPKPTASTGSCKLVNYAHSSTSEASGRSHYYSTTKWSGERTAATKCDNACVSNSAGFSKLASSIWCANKNKSANIVIDGKGEMLLKSNAQKSMI